MELTFRSPFSYGISNSSKRLPRNGLLLYLARPNSDEYLVGEDTEIGEDTYIWGYVLPDDSDIRAATGWVNGAANVFYTSTGVPIVALATEIAAAILPANVVFRLVDAVTQTGKLAIYTATTTEATLAKARSVLRDESINYLFYGRTAIAYDPQDLATLYQDASGTLPVYRPGSGAVDPPVGLMLDKSQGLELGPELASDTTPELRVYRTATENVSMEFMMGNQLAVGKSYIINITTTDNVGPSSASVRGAYTTTVAGVSIPGLFNGTKTGILTVASLSAPITSSRFYIGGDGAGTDMVVSAISIREIKGYHAYQSTTTARPALSGRYNLLTATETLSTQSVTTVATNYTLSFSGTGTIALSGTATGTYSAGTHTITCTGGTLTCTVAGVVTRADLRVKRDGSSLPAYQAVTNANTYDTAGFPLFLKRDRVDDDLIVQAPAITGQAAWGSIDTVDIAAATIAAGAYKPFGTITSGEPTCTQWIAIHGTLTAAEQASLERYVYNKSKLQVGA